MKVPSTTWVVVFGMKLRSKRGPSCEEVSDRATSVIEKTTPVIVIIDPVTVAIKALAPSAPPLSFHPQVVLNQSVIGPSRAIVKPARSIAPVDRITGRNQRLERMRSQYLKICDLNVDTFSMDMPLWLLRVGNILPLGSLPGPPAFQFNFQRHAQERPDQDDEPQNQHPLHGWSDGDSADYIGGYQKLQAKKDTAPDKLAE